MKIIKTIGLVVFILGLTIFTSTIFVGEFELTDSIMKEQLSEQEFQNLSERFNDEIVGKKYSSSFSLSRDIISIYWEVNEGFKSNKLWERVMWSKESDFAANLTRASGGGMVFENKGLFFFLTFVLGIFGSLMYIIPDVILLGGPGIKNNGIFKSTATNRGWIGIVTAIFLISFYVVLYFHSYIMINMIAIVDPVKQLFVANGEASQWFLYGLLYCVVMVVMGIKMFVKYRHNRYQIIRTISVLFFQIIFAFLLVEILPIFGMPGKDLKSAWPLDYYFMYDWNVQSLIDHGAIGKFVFAWGFILTIIVVPVMVYFYGKRWYCSWVCGCGGLAETLGDPYRQLSDKRLFAWKLEKRILYPVFGFVIIMTIWVSYHTNNVINHPEIEDNATLFGISAHMLREWYGFLIGSIFAGVIGTGFYPILGNRAWCRFGCPLAAYMGIVQRFKSKFRITTNGGQCISCGNCSTYCEQGIDVRSYAQKGQNIVRSSCVGCGVCSAVCPRGVLKLENGPNSDDSRMEAPEVILGNEGLKEFLKKS